MKQYYIAVSALLLFFISCTPDQIRKTTSLLNSSNLSSQLFAIDINKDTTLVTANGCILQIPKGSIQSNTNPVKLEIKEALSNTDIVLAGLSTTSGKQALSSGGMIYFNAASGYNISIKKEIKILVPTKKYERNMQVFKGDTTSGKINWVNPAPLPADETTTLLDSGKALFVKSCGSCHKVYDEFTGPALYGITEKRSKEWIYAFTRHYAVMELMSENAAKEIVSDTSSFDHPKNDRYPTEVLSDAEAAYYYHQCQKKKYGSEMPMFTLSDKQMDAIYTYIKNESAKRPDLKDKFKANCCDSCYAYYTAMLQMDKVIKKRQSLIDSNEKFFSLEREIPVPTTAPEPGPSVPTPTVKDTKVKPASNAAVYYTINITAVGWYNVDILMKDYSNCIPSELMVRIQGNYNINFNVTLIIPSVKAFIEGGKLNNGTDYGFDENDGRIPLPQGAKCIVMAYAEQGDQLLFGQTEFNAQTKQNIDLKVSVTTKAALKTAITALKLDDVNAEVKDSKNAAQIKSMDKKIQEIEKLKPKNCDCGFPMTVNTADSAKSDVVSVGNYY